MAGHDTTKPAGGSTFDLDEDLFNFPVIELTPEGLRDASAIAAAAEAEAKAKADAAKAAEAAKTAAAATTAAPLPSKDKPATASGATPLLNVTPAAAPPKGLVASKEARDAAAAAATVTTVVEAPGSRWKLVFAALGVLLVVNVAGLLFLYRSNASFGAGIEDLRSELGDATHRLERAREDMRERSSSDTGTNPYSIEDTVDAIERQALALAVTEIDTGDYGTARRRLYRLLAQADRMPPGLRAEIEPQATYLIAKSYYVEGEKRAEVLR